MSRRPGRQVHRSKRSDNQSKQLESDGHSSDADKTQTSKKPKRMSVKEANEVWEKNMNEKPPAPGGSTSSRKDGVKFNPTTKVTVEGEEGETSENLKSDKDSKKAKAVETGEE